jgi:hypothetical protein
MDDVQRAANKANVLARESLGQNGAVASDSSVTGNFVAVQCLDNCSFDDLTASNADFSMLLGGYAIPAGTIIYGSFTYIASNGGYYIAYKA